MRVILRLSALERRECHFHLVDVAEQVAHMIDGPGYDVDKN